MTTTIEGPADTDSARLDALVESRLFERSILADRLFLIADWADTHPGTDATDILSVDEFPGGDGTPSVAAFTAEPLAHALECSPAEAQALLADTLDLRHRLPRLWDQVHALSVPVWRARKIARLTRCLPREGAHWVDRQLMGLAGSLGTAALDRLVATAIARFSPELQKLREDEARSLWDVTVQHPRDWHGTSTLNATGDTHAVLEIHALVQDTADALPGDSRPLVPRGTSPTEPAGQRRFHAFAMLVREGIDQAVFDLSDATGQVTRAPRSNLRLVLHADLADLVTGEAGIGIIESLGPATLDLIKQWCGASHVTVQPVLDLADDTWSPRHDPPPRMAEQVILRDQRCVFPRCTRPARICDLDHVTPWKPSDRPPPEGVPLTLRTGGPPKSATGTTSLNLAPLCRRHHRAKTARTWTYERLPDGSYWWTGPHGQTALVTHEGSLTLP